MNIRTFEKDDRPPEFYAHIGPYALNRSVTKEMHDPMYGHIYDEPHAIWFVAINDSGELLGFCTLFEREKDLFLDNCYVVPGHRRNGVGRALFAARLEYAKRIANHKPIKGITMNESQYRIYLEQGFTLTSKRGKYYWLSLEVK